MACVLLDSLMKEHCTYLRSYLKEMLLLYLTVYRNLPNQSALTGMNFLDRCGFVGAWMGIHHWIVKTSPLAKIQLFVVPEAS